MSEKLTPKQEVFCLAYVETGNASEAYRRAYSAEHMKEATINRNASALLKNNKIATRLEGRQEQLAKRHEATVDAIVEELSRIAFANAGDFFQWGPEGVTIKESYELSPEQRAVVAEVSHTRTPGGGTIRVKMSDKQAALEKLGRYLGMFKEGREHTGKDGKPIGTQTTHRLDEKSIELLRRFVE